MPGHAYLQATDFNTDVTHTLWEFDVQDWLDQYDESSMTPHIFLSLQGYPGKWACLLPKGRDISVQELLTHMDHMFGKISNYDKVSVRDQDISHAPRKLLLWKRKNCFPQIQKLETEPPEFDQIEGLSMQMTQAMNHYQWEEHRCFVCGMTDHFTRDCPHCETFCAWHKEHLNSKGADPENKVPTP